MAGFRALATAEDQLKRGKGLTLQKRYLTLREYDLKINYVKGKENCIADTLSRCQEVEILKNLSMKNSVKLSVNYITNHFPLLLQPKFTMPYYETA